MHASFRGRAVWLILLSLLAVAPGALAALPTASVQFITDVYGRNENATNAALTVIRTGDTNGGCSVTWSVTGGSATGGSDFSPVSGSLVFAPGETFKNISLLITDDLLVESNETVNLALSGAVNATLGFPTNAVLTIFDNDVSNAPPVIQFVASVFGRFENQTAPLNVERIGDTNVACSVQWAYTGGAAQPFSDFFGGSSTINFAAGQTIIALPISIIDDALAEPDETAGFLLHSPVNATLGSPTAATLTIYDNDASNPPPASVVQFITDVYGRNENAGDASLTVTRSGDTSNACSVTWSVTGGSATAGTDYSPASGTLNFAAFETFKNISLLITDDLLVESNETVHLTLSNAVNVTIGFPSNAVLTIFDNDVVPSAELQITKTASASGLPVGSNVVFNLTLRNNGPATVTNQIVVSEALPPGLDYVGDNSAGSGAYYSFGLGQWVMPTGLVAGATQTVAITVRALAAGTYTNTASINVPDGYNDPDTNNNSASALVTVTNAPPPQADLQITKTASTGALPEGETAVFHLALRNNGPATVTNQIVVSEALPPGLDYVGDNSAGSGAYYSFGLGQWVMPTGLVAGATQTVAITVRALATGAFTNTAFLIVPPGVTDPDTNNNSSSVIITATNAPPPRADLQITKTASASSVPVGEHVVFHLVLRNNGPDTVTNFFSVSDAIPPGFQYVSNASSLGGYSGGQGLWGIPAGLASNATLTLDIGVRATTNGLFTNTAAILLPPGLDDPNTNNNSASAVVSNTPPQADVSVVKFLTASNVNVRFGDQVSFTIVVSNAGPSTVTNVVVPDFPDAGLVPAFVLVGTNASYTGNTFTISNLAAGEKVTLELRADVTAVGLLTNRVTAQVPASFVDTNLANNASFAYVQAAPVSDLQIFKTANRTANFVPLPIEFTIELRNGGPHTSSNMTVQDLIPPGTTLIGSNVPPGTAFTPASGQWTVPRLTNTESRLLRLTLVHSNGGTVTNVALILNAPHFDPTPLDRTNSFVAFWAPSNYVDLAVSVTVPTNLVMLGHTTRVEFAVHNFGPPAISNITVHTPLPPGVELVRTLVNPNWNFDTNTSVWTRTNAMASGVESFFTFDVRITNAGVKIFNALITGSEPSDPFLINNFATTNFLAGTVLNITGLVKLATNGAPLPGATITATGGGGPPRVTLTKPDGTFAFTNLPPGFYTITPSANGFSFAPVTQTVNSIGGTTNLPIFIATARNIHGVVRNSSGAGLPGITVQISGAASGTQITDSNGGFNFVNLNPGTYTVTPLTNGVPRARYTPTNATFTLGSLTNWTNSVIFTLTNQVVKLRAIEVNQAIQDWQNAVPLIQDKPALVRAFLELPGPGTPPVTVGNATLRGTRGGVALGVLGPVPAGTDLFLFFTNAAFPDLRRNPGRSLNFELPANWLTGQVTLTFEWTNGVVLNREPADAAGGAANDGAVLVNFLPMPAISVKFVRVSVTNDLGGTNVLSGGHIDELERRLRAIYPVSRLNVTRGQVLWPRELGAPYGVSTGELARLNSILWFMRQADVISTGIGLGRDPVARQRLYYGALSTGVRVDSGGLADDLPGDISCGVMPGNAFGYGRNRHAHELGHSLGRHHTVMEPIYSGVFTNTNAVPPLVYTNSARFGTCGDQADTNAPPFPNYYVINGHTVATISPFDQGPDKVTYGWDSHARQVVDPLATFELMSYCGKDDNEWRWISGYTYDAIKSAIAARFTPVAPFAGLAKSGPVPSYRMVRGLIDRDTGVVEWLPFYTVTPAEPFPTPAPGSHVLRVLDEVGGLITDIPFEPAVFEADGPGEASRKSGFIIPVPENPAIDEVQLWTGGSVLTLRQRSANGPAVQLLSPNGGQAFGSEPITINWFGSDLDGDLLSYTVQYSPDGGTSWDTLVADWSATSLTVESATLMATTQGKFRVIATDGFLTALDATDGLFTVLNHTPALVITSPENGQAVNGAQQLFLAASADDVDDGTLTGTNIVWTSSLNGLLGTGESLVVSADTLLEGPHTFTAIAIDSGGLTNSATVEVIVTRDPLPRLDIERLLPDVVLSWPVTSTNYHLQRALSLPGAWSNVTNTPQAVGEKWQVTLPASGTNRFFRLIKP